MNGQLWSVNDLTADLRQLGVAPGDVVMVHASLRAIGPVVGGAAGVIKALDKAVGPHGTVLMLLGAKDDFAWVNEHPELERSGLLIGSEPFDYRTTPADPDNGALAEAFRTTPGTQVSNHPEARFGARRGKARQFVSNVPWNNYFGIDSPLERLIEANGKVLRLGADLNTVTLIHYAEIFAEIDDKRRVRRHRLMSTGSGPELTTIECLDDSDGIVDYPGEDYFAVILRQYLETHHTPRGAVGKASSELLDATDLANFAEEWMTEHLVPDAVAAAEAAEYRRQRAASTSAEKGVHELVRIERHEVVQAFTQADKLHRDAEFGFDSEHNAALG
jgi:aminoglycoside N3'-acetyltransferase